MQDIEEKLEQLQLAAAYGQELLLANNALQKQLKDAEWALDQLQEQVQTLEKEKLEIQDELSKALEQINQCAELEKMIRNQESMIVTLEQEKHAHAEEQGQLLEQIKHWKQQANKENQASKNSIELQKLMLEYHEEMKRLQEQLSEAKNQWLFSEQKIQELDILLEQQAEIKEENEDLKLQLEAAAIHAEALEDTIHQLKELNGSKTEDGPVDVGGKTLLCEVDDKRQELQKSHQDLTRKHYGLLKMHSHSVHEKQRLQQHLAQLAHRSQKPSSDIVNQLEAALAQAKSEKRQLEAKIALLQDGPIMTILPDDTDAMAQYLKSKIDMLQNRVDELEATNRTMALMRENDAKKLLAAEKLLDEKTMELDNLQQAHYVLKQKLNKDSEEIMVECNKENTPISQPEKVSKKMPQKLNGPKRVVRRNSDDCKQQ